MMSNYLNLQNALLSNNVETLKRELNNASNVNDTGGSGITILHYYISMSSKLTYDPERIIALLTESGVNINGQNKEGVTPLHFAVSGKNIVITKALLAKGAIVDSQDNNGNTPLWRAVQDYRGEQALLEIIHVLINASSNPDIANKFGHSPRSIVRDRHQSMERTKKPKEWDLQPHLNW